VATLSTAEEPVALALGDGGRSLFVVSGWGAELAVFGVDERVAGRRVLLPREPRALVQAGRGRFLVAHAADQGLSVVAFDESGGHVGRVSRRGSRFHTGQGFALASIDGKIYAPQVGADADSVETYYGTPMRPFVDAVDDELLDATPTSAPEPPSAARGVTTTSDSTALAGPVPATFAATRQPSPSSLSVLREVGSRSVGGRSTPPHCLLPRAAAIREGKPARLVVACLGDDSLVEYRLEPSTPAVERMWRVSPGVSGLAYDAQADAMVAWAQYTRELVVLPLASPAANPEGLPPPTSTIAASGASNLAPELQLGRRVFHRAGDMRLSADGRACASCHPDGRDDGRTWLTPEGPRQTMMLAGRLQNTAPYGWTRHAPTLHDYVSDTITRLRGNGLDDVEMHALEAYVLSLSLPSAARRPEVALAARGKDVFESSSAGCASCHAGAATTDGKPHDVGSRWRSEPERAFATPSLRHVARTAPYFHDGRYATLRELLTDGASAMGSTKHLDGRDLDALEAYLGTL